MADEERAPWERPSGAASPQGERAPWDKASDPAPTQGDMRSFEQRLRQGLWDPILGAAQLGSRLEEPGEASAIAFGTDPAVERRQRQQTIDRMIKQREEGIAKERGADADSTDWARMLGTTLNPLEYLPGLMVGGVPGAVAGGFMGGALEPVTKGDTDDFAGEKLGQMTAGAGTGSVLGVGGKLLGAGTRAFGSWLTNNYPEAITNKAVQRILGKINASVETGGPTATDMLDTMAEARAAGKPMTLTDMSRGLTDYGGSLARQPGPTKEMTSKFMDARDKGAGPRLMGDVKRYIHDANMFETEQALGLTQRANATQPYGSFYALDNIWSDELAAIAKDPEFKSAMQEGVTAERHLARKERRPFDPAALGVEVDENGKLIRMLGRPTPRMLDLAKRGVDKIISDERNDFGKLSSKGLSFDNWRRGLMDVVDELDTAGHWRAAREAWAGPAASRDAMKLGKAFKNLSPDELAHEMGQLSPANQEFFRIGVANTLLKDLMEAGYGSDEAKRLIKNEYMRERLRPVFRSEKDMEAFLDAVDKEQQMFATKFAQTGGSHSAGRIVEDVKRETTEKVKTGLGVLWDAVHHNLAGVAHGTAKLASHFKDKELQNKVDAETARILFSPDITKESELGRRLTGQLVPRQPLGRTGTALRRGVQGAAPGTAAALTQQGPPDLDDLTQDAGAGGADTFTFNGTTRREDPNNPGHYQVWKP